MPVVKERAVLKMLKCGRQVLCIKWPRLSTACKTKSKLALTLFGVLWVIIRGFKKICELLHSSIYLKGHGELQIQKLQAIAKDREVA